MNPIGQALYRPPAGGAWAGLGPWLGLHQAHKPHRRCPYTPSNRPYMALGWGFFGLLGPFPLAARCRYTPSAMPMNPIEQALTPHRPGPYTPSTMPLHPIGQALYRPSAGGAWAGRGGLAGARARMSLVRPGFWGRPAPLPGPRGGGHHAVVRRLASGGRRWGLSCARVSIR